MVYASGPVSSRTAQPRAGTLRQRDGRSIGRKAEESSVGKMPSYHSVSRSTRMYCPCFQIMYGQDGSVSYANARLLKTSAIEHTIPNTIPDSTVFIGKLLASPGTSPQQRMSKMRRWCCDISYGMVFCSMELNLFGNSRCAASCRTFNSQACGFWNDRRNITLKKTLRHIFARLRRRTCR